MYNIFHLSSERSKSRKTMFGKKERYVFHYVLLKLHKGIIKTKEMSQELLKLV